MITQHKLKNKEYLSPNEIGAILSIHPNTIRNLVRKGKIESVKIGGSVRIPSRVLNEKMEGEKEKNKE